MSKCIGGVINDSLGDLLAYSPGKSFGQLFEEKKQAFDSLQAGLAASVMPSFPPMPAVKYSDIGFGVDLHKGIVPALPLVPVPNLSMVFDIMGAVFAGISSVLPDPPAPPPVAEGEEPAELDFCETVAAVGLALIKGMAPTVKVNGHWIGNAGIDVNSVLGAESLFPEQLEISIQGHVPSEDIVGVYPVIKGKVDDKMIESPNYKGNKTH